MTKEERVLLVMLVIINIGLLVLLPYTLDRV